MGGLDIRKAVPDRKSEGRVYHLTIRVGVRAVAVTIAGKALRVTKGKSRQRGPAKCSAWCFTVPVDTTGLSLTSSMLEEDQV